MIRRPNQFVALDGENGGNFGDRVGNLNES